MRKYELVVVLQARASANEVAKIVQDIEATFPQSYLEKDDIGVVSSSYKLHHNEWDDKIYLISYCLELAPTDLKAIEGKLKFIKGIVRSFFYSMKPQQVFFKYKDIQEKFKKMFEVQE